MITLGCVTLIIFLLRFTVFTFRESPKFLLSKGHDAHAIDVLYSIAKYNRSAPPRLRLEDFKALELAENHKTTSTPDAQLHGRNGPVSTGQHAKAVALGGLESTFGHMKGIFADRTYGYLFVIMAIA